MVIKFRQRISGRLIKQDGFKGLRTANLNHILSGDRAVKFRGNQAGNFQGSSSQPRIIQVVVGDRAFVGGFEISEPGSPTITGTTFNLNVTSYGQVGGRIQGNYTGTLRQVTGDKGGLGNTTITITGNFNVQRLPDGTDVGGDRAIKLFSLKEIQNN